jgi:hypothetical protein
LLASGGQRPYIVDEVAKLAETWHAMLRETGCETEVRPEPLLDGLEDQLFACLDDYRLVRLRYREHIRARALAESPLDQADGSVTVPVALNAAWIRRLRPDGELSRDDIAAGCERLIERALKHD